MSEQEKSFTDLGRNVLSKSENGKRIIISEQVDKLQSRGFTAEEAFDILASNDFANLPIIESVIGEKFGKVASNRTKNVREAYEDRARRAAQLPDQVPEQDLPGGARQGHLYKQEGGQRPGSRHGVRAALERLREELSRHDQQVDQAVQALPDRHRAPQPVPTGRHLHSPDRVREDR